MSGMCFLGVVSIDKCGMKPAWVELFNHDCLRHYDFDSESCIFLYMQEQICRLPELLLQLRGVSGKTGTVGCGTVTKTRRKALR
jgi:hypothetical protein